MITTLLLVPLCFRYSRLVMRYLFAGFDYGPAGAAAAARQPQRYPRPSWSAKV